MVIDVLEQDRYASLIEEKDYKDHEEVISKITHITGRAKSAGQVMSVIFAIIAILIVFKTVRIAIYTHREEITIMKTVGAANWFVKFPYIMQSVLYSFLAVGLTLLLLYPALNVADI